MGHWPSLILVLIYIGTSLLNQKHCLIYVQIAKSISSWSVVELLQLCFAFMKGKNKSWGHRLQRAALLHEKRTPEHSNGVRFPDAQPSTSQIYGVFLRRCLFPEIFLVLTTIVNKHVPAAWNSMGVEWIQIENLIKIRTRLVFNWKAATCLVCINFGEYCCRFYIVKLLIGCFQRVLGTSWSLWVVHVDFCRGRMCSFPELNHHGTKSYWVECMPKYLNM